MSLNHFIRYTQYSLLARLGGQLIQALCFPPTLDRWGSCWWCGACSGGWPLLHKNLYFRANYLEIGSTMWQLFKEFLLFLRQEKKWWLAPLVLILLLLAAVIVFTGGSVLAPLMYPFM